MPDYHSLPHLRDVLSPEYAILPSDAIRQHMESAYGPGAADAYDAYVEGIFGDIGKALASAGRDVGRFAVQAAPAVATVGGGALQGALSGAQFGLPGIIAGAAMGGAGAGLQRYGGKTAGNIGGALSAVTGLAGSFSPLGRIGGAVGPAISGLAGGGNGGATGAATSALTGLLGAFGGGGATGGIAQRLGGLAGGGGGDRGSAAGSIAPLLSLFGGGSAASQLLSLLQRPETMRALSALNLGPMGRRSIPVGSSQTQVPTAAISSLLAHLAGEASAEVADWSSDSEAEMTYMIDGVGDYVGDPALDRDRAARVWNLLTDAQAERVLESIVAVASEPSEDEIGRESLDTENDEELVASELQYYDALDLAEYETLEASRFDAEEPEDLGELVYDYA